VQLGKALAGGLYPVRSLRILPLYLPYYANKLCQNSSGLFSANAAYLGHLGSATLYQPSSIEKTWSPNGRRFNCRGGIRILEWGHWGP